MSEIKTIKEWLSELPEPARSQALENMRPVLENKHESCLSFALLNAFSWVNSPEGWSYWHKVAFPQSNTLPASPAPRHQSPWQPIDSAPADGTYVLVCYSGEWDNFPHRLPKAAYFGAFHPNAPGKMKWRDAKGSSIEPTHWMPLPSPPQS